MYGYRRVWALLRRQAELDGMPAINAERVYRLCARMRCCFSEKPLYRHRNGHILEALPGYPTNGADGFEFRCDNGEKLRVTFALDCCDREALHWAVTTAASTVKQYRT